MSTIKLPILKKGEYDIWAMKMEHYLAHTNYPIWEVIQKGNGPVSITTDTQGIIKVLPPRTAEEILARERERKARTTLLMALPEDHLAKFHKMTDAKEMWDAIKSRFGGNDESKKMQNTNNVSTASGVSPSSSHNSKRETSSSYTDDLMYSFFANQSNGPQLDHEDLEQINEYDLEEMDLKWQVAMISMRLKKFYKKTRRKLHFDAKEPIGSQDAKRKDAGSYGYKVKDNGRIQGKNEEPNALVTLDGEGINWTAHTKDEEQDFALMAFNNASSDTEVISCSTKCVESYSKLKKLYDEQRKQLSDANVEILAYSQGLKKVEAQLVTHQNNQLWYEQKNRFVTAGGMHVVPPPMIGNYMPSGPDIEIDESQFTYGPKQPQSSEPDTRSSYFESCESTSSVETPDCVTVLVVTDPKVVNSPKVWNDAPIIEEYESDSDDECVSTLLSEQEQPRETVQEHKTCSQNPKVNKKDLNGSKSTRMGLVYGGTRKGSYVCGSFSHLIRDCDFHEKRMAKQAAMNKNMSKSTNQKENRPIWNNVQRVNHLNQFVPSAVLTRSGKIPINTARTSSTNHVNTARQNVSTARQNSSISTARGEAVSAVGGIGNTTVKASAGCIWRPKRYYDDPQRALKHKGIVDSGCSRHMTGNKGYLVDYQDYNGGPVAFGGSKGQITGKGKIRTGKLDFDDVCFVKELQQFNFFSVSQMCDKKNKVLFTDTKCLVLSPNFKLSDENQATTNESNKWHRRLGHVNFKNLNKLVKGNLVRGLPSKIFQNDHTCVACQKGKQHKASCKAKSISSISQPLQLLHMDLFGPTSVRSINHKIYCLVITDDFSRCDNGTEFKNRDTIEFCGSKGIKREYSNVRTPQQNGVAERKNRTLIEAARTMLADSFLPNTFWAEAVSTACYVLNRVLVTQNLQNMTPYVLIT
ncbi:putative ribonuclease H-like domain-containing protein [Tanacetum coccineum]